MSEFVNPPPEHDHVEAWLATIKAVNPTSPFELAELRAEMQDPSTQWTYKKEARIGELGVAAAAVKNLVTEYLPLAKPYGRNTKADPSPFDYEDRLQAARTSLVHSAWQYRAGMVDKDNVPMTFADYAKLRMEQEVSEHKAHERRFFDLDAGEATVMFFDSRRNLTPGRYEEVDRFMEVQQGTAVEELEPEDLVTPDDPTFEAAARADLLRIYMAISTKWSQNQRALAAEKWGLLGGQPYEIYGSQGRDNGQDAGNVRYHIGNALRSLRATRNIQKFEGYVPDEIIDETRMAAQALLGKDPKPRTGPTSPKKLPERTAHSRVIWKNEQALEPGALQLKELLNNPELFSADRPDVLDLATVTQTILEACPDLNASHIEALWNQDVGSLVGRIHKTLGQKFELSRVGQIFSMLLRETMTEISVVTLHIPPHLDGKMNYVGAWLEKGSLRVLGSVGTNAGVHIGPDATINIIGSAGANMGLGARGYVTAHSRR